MAADRAHTSASTKSKIRAVLPGAGLRARPIRCCTRAGLPDGAASTTASRDATSRPSSASEVAARTSRPPAPIDASTSARRLFVDREVNAAARRPATTSWYANASTWVNLVELRYLAGSGYQLRTGIYTDGGSFLYSGYANISDGPHFIELDWQAASAPGANDGFLNWWIDGIPMPPLSGLDTDTHVVEGARLGAVSSLDNGTRGTYYFDAFASGREVYIGAEH